MRISFNWLKDYIDIRISPEAVAEKLTMAGLEVTSLTRVDHDILMDIEVTPNRTDCLSILGIARELAAITGKRLKAPRITSFPGKSDLSIPIQIQDKRLCQRYIGRVIKNVKVGPSPEWLVQRLEVMGIRTVNNIVDITNFCLLEFGQPLHAFSLDKLQGQRIIVRRALKGEQIVTIDGVKRVLDSAMLVIADKAAPQAIAGVMGAKASEVTEATTSIFLESAYFDPLNIHNTSRKLGLATQSSYRFERGVDFEGVYIGSLRATELIKRFARQSGRKSKPVTIGRFIDKSTKRPRVNKVRLRYPKVVQTLGVELSPVQIREILRRLNFHIIRKSKDSVTVKVPAFRADVIQEADLIEEVSRLYGYEEIPLSLSRLTPNLSWAGKLELASEAVYNMVRDILASLGLNEIMTYSLISRQSLRKLELSLDNTIIVKNPLSYEQEILRPTLLAGMLNTILINVNRKNINLRLFELSRIYIKEDASTTKEYTELCIGIAGKKSDNWMQKAAEYSFFDLKGIIETLLAKLGVKNFKFKEMESPIFTRGRCAGLVLNGNNLGLLGEIKKEVLERFDISGSVYAAELALHKILAYVSQEKRLLPLARFPSIDRDISLIAPQQVQSEQIVELINKIGRDLVAEVKLFDQYFGEQIPAGFRGLAYSIKYRSKDRTLTAEEVDRLHTKVRQALSEELKVQIR